MKTWGSTKIIWFPYGDLIAGILAGPLLFFWSLLSLASYLLTLPDIVESILMLRIGLLTAIIFFIFSCLLSMELWILIKRRAAAGDDGLRPFFHRDYHKFQAHDQKELEEEQAEELDLSFHKNKDTCR